MLTDAVRLAGPLATGSNFTVIRQEALTPRLCGQLFVSMKSEEFVPVKTMPDIPSEVVPGLDTVTLCGALAVPAGCEPKLRLEAEKVIPGAMAVPDNDTVCGLPAALSLKFKLAFFMPLDSGANFIVTVQLAPVARVPLEGQGLLPAGTIPKLPASLPVSATLEMFNVALPWFTSVTAWFPLVLPTACELNTNAAGDTLKSGAADVALPVNGIVCTAPGRFPELSVKLKLALNIPVADGAKDTCSIQFAPAGSTVGAVQVLSPSENSATFPAKLKLAICSG
jgi:hypothetical protein